MTILPPYSRATCALSNHIEESARLRLRPFAPADADAFWRMRSNPQVMAFIPLEVATDKAAIFREFDADLAGGERFKFFRAVEWKMPTKERAKSKPELDTSKAEADANDPNDADRTDGMIGWVLFRPTEDGRYVELGYWFLPEVWGQGVATEAAAAMVQGHREAVGVAFEDIYAEAFIGNHASRKVLENVGLIVTGEGAWQDHSTWVMHWKKPSPRKEVKS